MIVTSAMIIAKLKFQNVRRLRKRDEEFERLQQLVMFFEEGLIEEAHWLLRLEYRRQIAETNLRINQVKAAFAIGGSNLPKLETIYHGLKILEKENAIAKSWRDYVHRRYRARGPALISRILGNGLASCAIGGVADMLSVPLERVLPIGALNIQPTHESKGAADESIVSSRLPSALDEVVKGGIAGLLHAARNQPSSDRVSVVMREMLADDPSRYGWTADDWVRELGCSKKTIIGNKRSGVPPCDAWREIMAWRESNKANRVPKSVF